MQVLGQPRWHSQSLSKKKKTNPGQERWILFAIPALCSLRQEDHQRFKASLGYRDPVFKKKKKKTPTYCSLSPDLPAEYSHPL